MDCDEQSVLSTYHSVILMVLLVRNQKLLKRKFCLEMGQPGVKGVIGLINKCIIAVAKFFFYETFDGWYTQLRACLLALFCFILRS